MPLVLEAVRFGHPHWSDWTIVTAVKMLIHTGHDVPGDEAARSLDPVFDESLARGRPYGDGQDITVESASLLLHTSRPELGVERMRRAIEARRVTAAWHLRDFLEALAHSGCQAGLELLLHLMPESVRTFEWVKAASRLGGASAEEVLYRMILDPDQRGAGGLRYEMLDPIASFARQSSSFRDHLFLACGSPLTVEQRCGVARILERVESEEAGLAALDLLDDSMSQVLSCVEEVLERLFAARILEPGTSVFSLEGQARPRLRSRLFELTLNDGHRCRSAFYLLVAVDCWRGEYGKPLDEPRHPGIDAGVAWPDPTLIALARTIHERDGSDDPDREAPPLARR